MADHDTYVRFVSNRRGTVTVGVDIGTTSVKALAVDEKGEVLASSRVPHRIVAPEPDQLRHDAKKAWHTGPKKAYDELLEQLIAEGNGDVSGVTVASMVPSLTAVNRRGVPVLPGLLYGDIEGRSHHQMRAEDGSAKRLPPGAMVDTEGFMAWAVEMAPKAAGYWPCQAVATHALSGVPAIDGAVTSSLGALHSWGKWNSSLLETIGVSDSQLPIVVPMAEAGGMLPGSDTVFTGGSIDALCDQLVAGAVEVGDVYVIFGATLIVWVITDQWLEVPELISYPHTTPDRFTVGGPSNAGALFVDWVRQLMRQVPRPGPDREKLNARLGLPGRVPVWLPYIRGERVPFNDYSLRGALHDLDIASDGFAIERAAFESSGFVIRRIIEMSGLPTRRIVASGGGSRVTAWMSAVADASNLPVQTVAVPDGAARGAAFIARMAAGLETNLNDSTRWAGVGRTIEPDPAWLEATSARYERFQSLGTGS
jgi:xylulokinase